MPHEIEFEWTLLDGRKVVAHADAYSSGDWSVGLGPGFEEVWVTDDEGNQIDISDKDMELVDAEAQRIGADYDDDGY